MHVHPDSVWRALADGYSYSGWVVGTRKIREVETGFPAVGKRLHYTVGYGPMRHEGHTEVISSRPGECLELEVHAWPGLAVKIVLTVTALGDDSSEVSITEFPDGGVGRLLRNPLTDMFLKVRNVETLRRLERIANLHGGRVAQR
jgi:uncharacterized protein YndB with AHSA1/START domain